MLTGGVRTAIAEAHNRYRLPITLTEVHLGCSVDEQMRWFYEAWQAAEIMRERGRCRMGGDGVGAITFLQWGFASNARPRTQ
jgi:hypothetical protein